jgi:glutathione S-transferase
MRFQAKGRTFIFFGFTKKCNQNKNKNCPIKHIFDQWFFFPLNINNHNYESTFFQTNETLEKIENELSSNLSSDSINECEIWVLGSTFSAVDITLGVILNRLALLGFGPRFWGQRPFLKKFVQQIQHRPSFVQSVSRVGHSQTSTGTVQMDMGTNFT